MIDGTFVVQIEEEDTRAQEESLKNALIGYVLGDNPYEKSMENYVTNVWNFVAKPKILYHDEGYYIFQFQSIKDRDLVLHAGPYTYHNKPIILQHWKIDFCFNPECLSIIPLWVKFLWLPLGYWSTEALSKLASVVGKPLHTDRVKAEMEKASYARVLVETDVSHPLPEKCWAKRKQANEEEFKEQRRRRRNKKKKQITQQWVQKIHVSSTSNEVESSGTQKEEQVRMPTTEGVQPTTNQAPTEDPNMALSKIGTGQGKQTTIVRGNTAAATTYSNRFAILQNQLSDQEPRDAGPTETRAKERKSGRIIQKVARDWNVCCNYKDHPNGRIWLMWRNNVNIQIIETTDQYIHCEVQKDSFKSLLTVVGDFNNVLTSEDRIGAPVTQAETQGFQNLVDVLQLTPLKSVGWFFTWCNQQQEDKRVYSKIDWAMGNYVWLQQYSHIEAEFMDPGVSDHSPILIHISQHKKGLHPKPFKLYKNVMEHPEFRNIVQEVWQQRTQEEHINKIWKKLKALKNGLKDLNKYMASYQQILDQARQKLEVVQGELKNSLLDQSLFNQEKEILAELEIWSHLEEPVLQHKSRATWIECGDSNTKYFHAQWKMRTSKNHIASIYNASGIKLTDPVQIEEEFISFFTNLIGEGGETHRCPDAAVVKQGRCLDQQQKEALAKNVTNEEILAAIKICLMTKPQG
ncbi:PREDICTED: uncharacterized protein LOC109227745 [Nicotiana attenuata]|uniref:uncharacterized protein LOC109227745 n=1 Tax=Nicotiana attenuata TaxID=49451 RepID=UPI000905BA6A|nr:PREDICTED: uncharacterized protein LOC109227745 [Nicotiana attenuata]